MLIFDSSTLILLAKIDMLELFVKDFKGEVLIPEKVRKEACDFPGSEVPYILKLIKEKEIRVVSLKARREIKKLMEDFNIDTGEAEAIVLAIKKGCRIVATDDRNAIRACKLLGLDFITAVTVLIRAYEKGILEMDEALAKLDTLAQIGRYSQKIISDAKERIKGGA